MDHPFAPVVTELKTLQRKLNASTYEALFGRTLQERQSNTTEAIVLRNKIDNVLSEAARSASQVSEFLHLASPHNVLQSVAELIRLVDEHPKENPSKVMSGGQPGPLPSAPSQYRPH